MLHLGPANGRLPRECSRGHGARHLAPDNVRRRPIEQDRSAQALELRIRHAESRARNAEAWMRRLEQQRDEAFARAAETAHDLRALETQLRLLQTSTSWRITAPLRHIVTGLRSVAGRGVGGRRGPGHSLIETEAHETRPPAPLSPQAAPEPPRPATVADGRRESSGIKSILILDHAVPKPDQDAGSRAIMDLMLCLLEAGWRIYFWPQDRRPEETYTAALEGYGVDVIGHRWTAGIGEWLRQNGTALGHILISRATVAEALVMQVIAHSAAPLAYYGHDIAFARLEMEAALRETPVLLDEVSKTRAFERRLWRLFDRVIYLSEEEAATVRALEPSADARAIIPFSYESFADVRSPPPSQVILFVAGFAHAPNVDAAEFLVYQVLPLVQAQCPKARVSLVGSNPSWAVSALAGPAVEVTGWVSDAELTQRYRESRAAVVPLRFGAGVKGKVVQALQQGLPLVASPVGAQGIPGLSDVALIRQDPAEIADALIGLMHDDESWAAQSNAQLAFAKAHYSRAAMRASVLRALDAPDRDSSF